MIIKLLLASLLLSIPLYFFLFYQEPSSIIKQATVQGQNLSTPAAKIESDFKAVTPSIDQIFAQDHSWINALPSDRKRVLIATGDVIPARVVRTRFKTLLQFLLI